MYDLKNDQYQTENISHWSKTLLAHPIETKSIGQTAKHLPIQESFVQYDSFVSNDLNWMNTYSFNAIKPKHSAIQ